MDYTQLISNLSLNDSSESLPSPISSDIERATPKLKSLAVKLDGIDTELLFGQFEDNTVVIASQFEKLGTIYKITKDHLAFDKDSSKEVFHTIKCLFGLDDIVNHAAARLISEGLEIGEDGKPLILIICLKDHTPEVLKAIVTIINETWGHKIK